MAQTKKNIINEPTGRLLDYGQPVPLINSEEISTLTMRNPHNLMFEVDLISNPKKEPSSVRAWINWGRFHSCECHKVAALSFYQWTKDGKYEQVPMIDGIPSTNLIILGELEEVDRR